MWLIKVGDSEKQLVGYKEKEFLVSVFKDCCCVEEIDLPDNNSSANLIGDERSL